MLAVVLLAALPVAAIAAGWDAVAWVRRLWDSFTSMSLAYVVPALALQTLQMLLAATALHAILRRAYRDGGITRLRVLACFAVGSAVNAFVPANLGALVMVLMLVATVEAATPAGVVSAVAVEKLFWFGAGVGLNVYATVTVGASFRDKLAPIVDHPWAVALLATAAAAVVAVGGRLVWARVRKLWSEAKQGGSILRDPRAYLRGVLLPQALAWCCKGGIVGVLLAAFSIPVGVHVVLKVMAGNTLAGVASVTPGGVGVTQAFNVASLHGAAGASTANAYSIASHLIATAWNVVLAAVFVTAAFGWAAGRGLVEQAYRTAKTQPDA